jgi:hypothetical protein
MCRRLFQLRFIDDGDLGERADGVGFRAAKNGVAFGVLGALEAVFPAGAGVEDDALVEPFFSGGGGAS